MSWKKFTYGAPSFETFDAVIFKNGYSKNAREMKIEFKQITIGTGNPKWGGGGEPKFIIHLGKMIETKNC